MRISRISQPLPQPRRSRRRPGAVVDWEGFQVYAVGGRVGLLQQVRSVEGAPVLAVGAGAAGKRLLIFPATAVRRIDVRRRRLELDAGAAPVDSEPQALSDAA
jgi:hypothetical protein